MDPRMQRVVDQQEIRDVIYRYCRGIDRCDYDLVRSCYHVDATDDHGDFRGGVDDPVAPGGWSPDPTATLGRRDGSDAVFAPSIADLAR